MAYYEAVVIAPNDWSELTCGSDFMIGVGEIPLSKEDIAFNDFLGLIAISERTKQQENFEFELLKSEFIDWGFIEEIKRWFIYISKEKRFVLCRLLGLVNMKHLQKSYYFRISYDCLK